MAILFKAENTGFAGVIMEKTISTSKIKLHALRCFFTLAVILLAAAGCAPAASCGGSEPAQRILFLGNSYTYTNDLPGMFTRLACAGGHKVETAMVAEGGWSLDDHVHSNQTQAKIKEQKWDYVILQEQSEIPAVDRDREASMYPAARVLAGWIRAAGAQPMLFMTWAHRDGLSVGSTSLDYAAMQNEIYWGYLGIANELNIPYAAVGSAWQRARSQAQPLDLWQSDGSHPNEQGTYLAACVFYEAIFHQSPQGLTYTAGLPKETAKTLQDLAAEK